MNVSVKEIILKSEKASEESCTLYERLGLIVNFDKGESALRIYSCEDASITSVDSAINIEIFSKKHLNQLIEDGFLKADDEKVTIMDDIGNKLLVSFNPRKTLKRIAVLTSGGDAPGMNSAIRAVLRTGIKWGSKVYGVYCGYEGLIEDMIEELEWDTLSKHSCDGGTFLQSARSKRFLTKEGRKLAVYNLVKKSIGGVVVIGGDGSLTGAMVLKSEFKTHVEELIAEGKLKDDEDLYPANSIYDISIVTIPASIDNDIPVADTTIGSDSALHRVIEAVDTLTTTMESHRRAIVVEVMGRHCGWIALMSAIATAADYVFLPERPANWETESINAITKARSFGKRGVFLVLSEGAVDSNGQNIQAESVKNLLENKGIETRILRLGHLQRGGAPSAYDRILATLLGCKAVEILLTRYTMEPVMMCLTDGEYKAVSLSLITSKCQELNEKRIEQDFDFLFNARGNFFKRAYELSEKLRKGPMAPFQVDSKIPTADGRNGQDIGINSASGDQTEQEIQTKDCQSNSNKTGIETSKKGKKIGVLHEGKRAGGMNVALNAVVQYGLSSGQEVIVITDGFDGLMSDQIVESHQYEFISGIHDGGSLIGSSQSNIDEVEKIFKKIVEHKIDSLIVVGGYESLIALFNLHQILETNNTKVDVILIPATADNNLPLTDLTIGSDTALNTIMKSCDYLKLSSISMKHSAFIVEVSGENCGYLALMSGIASGAFEAFIPERKYMISHLSEIAQRLRHRFKKRKDNAAEKEDNGSSYTHNHLNFGERHGVILIRNENTFNGIDTKSFGKLLATDSSGRFNTKFCVLGHLQRGGNPSPIDRINATVFGVEAIDLILKGEHDTVGMIGIDAQNIKFFPIKDVVKKFDLKNKRDKFPKWLVYSNICRSLE